MAWKLIAIGLPNAAHAARVVIRNSSGQPWTGTGQVFEDYVTANLNTYGRAMTQQGTASRHYTLTFPALPADHYSVTYYQPSGTVLVETDTILNAEDWEWNGTDRITAANVKKVNDVDVIGTGVAGDRWRPDL